MPANSHFEFPQVPLILNVEPVMLLKTPSTLLLYTDPTE